MSMGRSIFVAPQTCMVRALKYSWTKKFRIPTMKGHGTMRIDGPDLCGHVCARLAYNLQMHHYRRLHEIRFNELFEGCPVNRPNSALRVDQLVFDSDGPRPTRP